MKKKHQVNMQRILNDLPTSRLDGSLLKSESEATRLKVMQPDRTSHVRTKKSGLVKSLASSTITGMITMRNVRDPVSKKKRYPSVSNTPVSSLFATLW